MTRALPDASARETAARSFDRNLVVVAGAGTGKTSLLVERLLNLVLGEGIRWERTAAITFTEKAAAEMKERATVGLERILAAAESGSEEGPATEAGRVLCWLRARFPDSEIRDRAESALSSMDRATVCTLHAFCSDLLKRYPMEANVPPDFSLGPAGDLEQVFRESWPDFLERELGPEPPRAELWRRVLAAYGEEPLQDLARSLARNPAALDLLLERGYAPADPREVFGETLGELKRALIEDRERYRPEKGRTVEAQLDTAIFLVNTFLDEGGGSLRERVETAPRPQFLEDNSFNATKSVPAEVKAEIEGRLKRARTLLKKLAAVDEPRIADALEALRPFALEFRERITRTGALSFDDLLVLARNLLRNRPEVRTREAGRLDTLLVDEFQDTDPLQYEILFLLGATRDPKRGESAYALPLTPGKLFIVGDPKQSIYRFRGADMAAYRRAVDHILGSGGREEHLVTNFRSGAGILDPVNAVCENWIGEGEPTVEPEYVALAAAPGAEDAATEVWSLDPARGNAVSERRWEEAKTVVAAIAEGTSSRNSLGFPVQCKDIAILFRSMADVPLFAREFRNARIPFVVEGGNAFAERPEVTEALALLTALANPADPVATVAVLRGSGGGVSDDELVEFVDRGGRFYWPSPPAAQTAEACPTVAAGLAWVRELDASTRHLPLDARFHAVLSEGRFPILQAAFSEGSQRVANVRKLAERAAGLARVRGLTEEETLVALHEELQREEPEEESPLADEGLDAVRMLSIHRAKGLEFPVVFLPDLSRQPGRDLARTAIRVLRTRERDELAVHLRSENNAAMVRLLEEDERHRDAESKRLLYVALTRARRRLILLNHAKSAVGPWVQQLSRWGYRVGKEPTFPEPGDLGFGVHHRIPPLTPSLRVESETSVEAFAEASRAFRKAASRERPPSRFTSPSGLTPHAAPGSESRRPRGLALAVGTAVHRILERWRDHPAVDGKGLAAVAEAAALEEGADIPEVVAEVKSLVETFRESDLARRLESAEACAVETPILYRTEDGTVVHGFADLIYRWEGELRVADFKTDREGSVGHAARYRTQLSAYAEAVRRHYQLPEPPPAEIWYLRTGQRIELSEAPL